MRSTAEKRRLFRDMHESGCFVLPNPWDAGSARWLEGQGFKALATTSAGAAWSLGYADGAMPLEPMLDHIRSVVAATGLPVNADFLNGFATEPEKVAANVCRCIETGVAGLSIEDSTGNRDAPLYDIGLAAERIMAARAAIDASGSGVVLVGRAECYLTGHAEPLKESIRRLQRYAEAGADCLYAPGPRKREDIEAIVEAVAPKPVNLLVGGPIGLSVAEIADLGVRRISVGGALARAAWGGFLAAARGLAAGRFDGFAGTPNHAEVNGFFIEAAARRPE